MIPLLPQCTSPAPDRCWWCECGRFIIAALICLLAGGIHGQTGLSRDAEGWTVFVPSADSRIVYVDSESGNDATGGIYGQTSPEVGNDPFRPTGPVQAYKTIATARSKLRSGYPDWMLLRRGGVWYDEGLAGLPNGRSPSERTLVGWYGETGDMPLLKTGSASVINSTAVHAFLAIVGIDCYAHTRDPSNATEYVSEAGNVGFRFIPRATPTESLLWEGCRIRFYQTGFVLQNSTSGSVDIVIRRCVITDSYSTDSHSQGLYSSHFGMTIEECVFDHNGWLIQGNGQNSKAGGGATMFNHNTYCGSSTGHFLRGNLFLRSASIQNKWRCDVTGGAEGIVIDDNFYMEGELGISLGGNTSEPLRFRNSRVTNNVMMHIGRTKPTGRYPGLAWYIGLTDLDGALISGNLLLQHDDPTFTNAYGIQIGNTQRNVHILDNCVYNINNRAILIGNATTAVKENVLLDGNQIQQPVFGGALLKLDTSLAGASGLDTLELANNRYYSSSPMTGWFTIGSASMDLPGWVAASGEPGAQGGPIAYPDPGRGIEDYHALLGGDPSFEAFLATVRGMGRFNWDDRYLAPALNRYIREGFLTPLELWRLASFGSPGNREAGEDAADADGDRLPNLLEFLTGQDPLRPSPAPLRIMAGTGGHALTCSWVRADESETALEAILQWSTDLIAWHDAPVGAASSGPDANGVTITVLENGTTPDTIAVTLPSALAASGRIFARLTARER